MRGNTDVNFVAVNQQQKQNGNLTPISTVCCQKDEVFHGFVYISFIFQKVPHTQVKNCGSFLPNYTGLNQRPTYLSYMITPMGALV